eukprot:COSAG02_NODE_4218_length_5619_cov_1.862138_8_plen_60_part_00
MQHTPRTALIRWFLSHTNIDIGIVLAPPVTTKKVRADVGSDGASSPMDAISLTAQRSLV